MPELLPLEPLEPDPVAPLLESEPVLPAPLELEPGEVGEVGEVLPAAPLEPVLGEVLLELPLLPVPVAPLAAPAPDLLKCASHSEREIDPSLLLSTDEKLGAEVLVLLLPDMPDELPELPPEADGVEEDAPLLPELPPVADGVDDDDPLLPLLLPDEELWATATLDIASSAAAVAALNSFMFNIA